MNRIEEFKKLHGQNISSEVYQDIKDNYFISKHAQEQLEKRSDLLVKLPDGRINFTATKRNINQAMDDYVVAYYNTDGSVNIALNDYNYFVFAWNEERYSWTMITYKEMSWFSITIWDKQKMAIDGFDRQYK
jgi:predicted secreted hydrolase